MKKLRILFVNNTKTANPSYVVRNQIVAEKLNKMGHEVDCRISGSSLDVDDYDIFVFNRFYDGTLMPTLAALREMGKTIVYETDDYYEAISDNNPFHKIKSSAVLSSRELIRFAHGITVSTHQLKEEIQMRYGKRNVLVVPNCLDFTEYKKRKGGNKKVKIGWQGSNIHISDLLMVIDVIERLQKEHDIEFVIFGIDDKPLEDMNKFVTEEMKEKWKWSEDFKILYKKLKKIKYTHIPSVSYDEFRGKLSEANFDIGIIPLEDTWFGRSKSCLKFYEYAAVGTVSLASKVLPYTAEMNEKDLVKNRFDKWYAKLERLVVDEEYRSERLKEQEEWVKRHRDMEKMSWVWENVYYQIINFKKNEKSIIGTKRN